MKTLQKVSIIDTDVKNDFQQNDMLNLNEYKKAVEEVINKILNALEAIEFSSKYFRYNYRIKDKKSIEEKQQRKQCELKDLTDIAGIRFVFGDFSLEDEQLTLDVLDRILNETSNDINAARIYVNSIFSNQTYSAGNELTFKFVELIKTIFKDKITIEKDYIRKPKPSGYQSYHIVVEASNGYLVEIQARNLCQHIWSFLEHDRVYKGTNQYKDQFIDFAKDIQGYAKKYPL